MSLILYKNSNQKLSVLFVTDCEMHFICFPEKNCNQNRNGNENVNYSFYILLTS